MGQPRSAIRRSGPATTVKQVDSDSLVFIANSQQRESHLVRSFSGPGASQSQCLIRGGWVSERATERGGAGWLVRVVHKLLAGAQKYGLLQYVAT